MGIALVTGASAGLGAEFAKLFARQGHSVILVARRRDRLASLASEIEKMGLGVQTWIFDLDLSRPEAPQNLFSQVEALGLKVDFLVNNAGFGSGGRFFELDLRRELEMIDLNVRALVELTHLFLPQMLKRGSGHVLNVGSVAGFQPGPFMNTYSASKAFVNSFSEGLHEELRGTGVSCTVLAPGYTVTEFQKAASIAGFSGAVFNKALPAEVAQTGYRAMLKGSALKVAGFLNFLGTFGVRFLPRAVARKIAAQVNRSQV